MINLFNYRGTLKINLLVFTFVNSLIFSKIGFADSFGIYEDSHDNYNISFGSVIFISILLIVLYKWFDGFFISLFIVFGIFLISKGGIGIVFGLMLIFIGMSFIGFDYFKKIFNDEPSKSISKKQTTGYEQIKNSRAIIDDPLLSYEKQEEKHATPTPEQIREAREALGKTQETMARIFGVTHATWKRWEEGHCAPISSFSPKLWKIIEMADNRSQSQQEWFESLPPGGTLRVIMPKDKGKK